MTLEDDIARVAKLRGVMTEAAQAQARARQQQLVEYDAITVFMGFGRPEVEMAAFDQLPLASRRVITGLDVSVSAIQWRLLLRTHDEAALIAAVQRHVASKADSSWRDG